ncbi:MAG: hypothetical protein HKN74_05800 [Acidimicrobiia bacterium]|nr:hypothetical protein [Acidimicrobiia bacterium]
MEVSLSFRWDHWLHRHTHARSSRLCAFGLVVAAAALIASCGGSGSSPESTAASPAESTTTTAAKSTTTTPQAFTETSDIVYMTVNGVNLLMDVYTPAGEGPWPVVVAFHGVDSRGKDSQDNVPIAEGAAAEGMLVYVPSWIVWEPSPFPITVDIFRGWTQAANCAVAFAQDSAAALGSDPDTTVVYGFSGGGGAALLATVEPSQTPIDGCATDAVPEPVTGAVLGDAVYFLHNQDFDPPFAEDPVAMQAEVDALTNPSNWPDDLDTVFRLWVAEGGTNGRLFGDPADASSWLALRDPTGSIRADLERIGELEDGEFSTVDAGKLLELRLSEAGFDVMLDVYPGGHTINNKVPELIAYVLEVAPR